MAQRFQAGTDRGFAARIAMRLLAGWLILGLPLAAAAEPTIGAERCARNKAAGEITFLTSFAYAASTGILDVLAAQKLGFFEALCLNLRVQPGSTNAQLVSAGAAQLAGLGDAASLLVAINHGASAVGIATYGNTSAVELITLKGGPIKTLADLRDKTVGYKVALAPQIAAMLVQAGLDLDSINFVSVGFNPVSLVNGSVAAMIGYKSNEPIVLRAGGADIVEWDPERYGIHSTFNVLTANRAWSAANRSAVEDFLRATLHAYEWINASDANLDSALDVARTLSTAGFDLKISRERWRIETALIKASQPAGTPVGYNSPEHWQAEADALIKARLLQNPPATAQSYDNSFIAAIYDKERLIWPAP